MRLIPELAEKKKQQAEEAKAKFAADAEVGAIFKDNFG